MCTDNRIFEDRRQAVDELCGYGKCFDIKRRGAIIGGRQTYMWYASSLTSDLLIEQIISFCISSNVKLCDGESDKFLAMLIPVGDVKCEIDQQNAAFAVFDGDLVIMIDGIDEYFVCDTKKLPSRGISEPESDRVLRGSRDGFVENILTNAALLRKRLKSSSLVMKKYTIGSKTGCAVIACFLSDRAEKRLIDSIDSKLSAINTDSLSMGQESLAECLIKRAWYNPFPKFRYTERPDAAAAMILEGSVIILCENSPQAMILPCSIFDFLQESDDFYFPPLIGTYLRVLRLSVFFIALFLTPAWYLLNRHPSVVPDYLSFILTKESGNLPIIVQLLLVEFTIDGLKLATLNTPDLLSGSLSVVAGLIIGDFAVEVGWLSPEVILYMSFASMANFAQPSFELGYSFKFMRIMILLLTAFFDVWGFVAGVILMIVFIVSNKSADGVRGYLYPLIPWNKEAMIRQFFRPKKQN